MKVLITGASGFVGDNLRRRLPDDEVIGLISIARPDAPAGTLVADLRDALPVGRLPGQVDVVVHLAQPRADSAARERDELAINVAATDALLRYAVDAGARCFIFASSGNVYARSTAAHRESDPLDVGSLDPYVRAKIAGEEVVGRYAAYLTTVVARLFVPYGPGQSARRMIPAIAGRVRSGTPVVLVNEGQPATNPVHIDDASRQLAAMMLVSSSCVVNLAGTEVCTIRDLALRLSAELRREVTFVLQKAAERFDLLGDADRIAGITGIRPAIGLDAGLRGVIRATSGGAGHG